MTKKRLIQLQSTDPNSTLSLSQVWCTNEPDWSAALGPASIASYNKAYKAFIKDLKPAQAELLAAAAEGRQSLEMIAKRATQLTKFVRAVLKFRFGDASRALFPSGDTRRNFRPVSHKPQDVLLEYSFGWAPLVGDISDSLKTLTGGLPSFKVHGKGTVSGVAKSDVLTHNSSTGLNVRTKMDSVYYSKHSISARVGAINPNLILANQLGLVNPLFAAWEFTPWSFVADYFVNVGEFLNGFTDLLGFQLLDTNWTWKAFATSNHSVVWYYDSPPQGTGGSASWSGDRLQLQRDVGPLSGPKLSVRWPWQLSPKRAATSVALLLQQLHRVKR
jgi:hypothetical protein